jgi:uncharacterized repeat protein (TIGR04138 family)
MTDPGCTSQDEAMRKLQFVAERLDVDVVAAALAIWAVDHCGRTAPDATPGAHVSPAALCHAVVAEAKAGWGVHAAEMLALTGIRRSEDLGRVVLGLCDAGLMRRATDDTLEAFGGVFDMEQLAGDRMLFDGWACPGCGYALTGMAGRRCSECGRTFRPADFVHMPTRFERWARRLKPWCIAGGLHFALLLMISLLSIAMEETSGGPLRSLVWLLAWPMTQIVAGDPVHAALYAGLPASLLWGAVAVAIYRMYSRFAGARVPIGAAGSPD